MAAGFLSSVAIFITICSTLAIGNEPTCSKLMYDKQMLETMVRLEAKMNQWDRDRKAFEESVLAILKHRREEMDQQFLEQNEKLESMHEDYMNIREELENKTLQLEKILGTRPKVAFNAYTTASGNYSGGQVLQFSNVLLNEGDGFDKNTGFFTAPMTGLYQFSVHICNVGGHFMMAAIVHESTEVAITTVYENKISSCNSVIVPVMMKKGERVHVKSKFSDSRLRAIEGNRWPSFTGVLLSN